MPKIKLLDNLIISDGNTIAAGTEIDTETLGIDADGLDNLLGWKAVEVIGASDPATTVGGKKPKATDPGADVVIDPAPAAS